MTTLTRQRGASMLAMLYFLTVTGFLLLLAFRLVPLYLDNSFVAAAVKSLEEVPQISQKSPSEVKNLLMTRFQINNIRNVDGKAVKVEEVDGKLVVDVNYDVAVPIIANVEALVHFKNHFEARRP
ncbi:MAG: DUF4845 domain-containing protein [Pseudomonadales bacterium]|jgi:hypothetical protein|nr:DUF4845 domain-containing protein [Pseudomonadales bacterium]MCC6529504.1 DUF4845 domain-containing protein [Pseudomonadales bacterium]MCP5333722.1 DUF4845 domain-containing protein [Pseudomonadales bacterium]HMU90714.1 DUF4845 domain-containing protein [Pseudomonadales bacterium]HMW83821.1 DUF4845 domain-containing protein [Pseudomonadales bacterium]